MQLKIFFNGQFWVGLIERQIDDKFYSSLYTFGKEPTENQILEFVQKDLQGIIEKQSEYAVTDEVRIKEINPKRLKRLASKEMEKNPLSTKSQEAIQKQIENDKNEKKKITKEQKEQIELYKRQKAIEKRKNKHKGH
jgi:hypothetical protein